MKEGQVARGQLLKAREDTAILLELVDATLDQMALFVLFLVILARLGSVLARRDDRHTPAGFDEGNEGVAVIPSVGNDVVAGQVAQQRFGLGDVMSLTRREPDNQRVAQGIYHDVNLGAESAPAPSERLGRLSTVFWAAPAAQGCARTTVLSGITLSMSASSLK